MTEPRDPTPLPALRGGVMKHPGRIPITAALIIIVIGTTLAVEAQLQKLSYPTPRKSDVVDEYFGTKVADPYRWMEDLDSHELAEWVAAENKLTFNYLERLPLRQHFRQRITELWNYPRTTIPVREGGRFFYRKNSGLQRQS
ncbi:MAG TPA: hypothetical protein VE616_01220, partial [Candidatus Udaeobacter sp.]|nr:hypothetical protein [Candidatus Udaeobacter sp.]